MKRAIQIVLLFVAILFCQRADAAVAFVQKSLLCTNHAATIACTLNGVTLGNYLHVVGWGGGENSTTCTGVSDGTNTFTINKTQNFPALNGGMCMATFGPYASGGNKTVTITFGASNFNSSFVLEFSGLTTPVADLAVAVKTGTSAAPSTNAGTTAIADEVAISMLLTGSTSNPETITDNGGFTLGRSQLNGATQAVGGGFYLLLTTVQSISDNWTTSSNVPWQTLLVTLKGTAATPRQVGAFLVGP